jgi:hypothetical protein
MHLQQQQTYFKPVVALPASTPLMHLTGFMGSAYLHGGGSLLLPGSQGPQAGGFGDHLRFAMPSPPPA